MGNDEQVEGAEDAAPAEGEEAAAAPAEGEEAAAPPAGEEPVDDDPDAAEGEAEASA